MVTYSAEVLLQLIRISLGKEDPSTLSNVCDWSAVYSLALSQGTCGLCVGAVNRFGQAWGIDENLRYTWIAQTMVMEQVYERHCAAISHLSQFYAEQGLRMLLLKGYGLSQDWPIPSYRPCGDLDVYLLYDSDNVDCCGFVDRKLEAWKAGDRAVEVQLGIAVDYSHHHHSVFTWEGFCVENHYDLINTYSLKSNHRLEQVLKEWILYGWKLTIIGYRVDGEPVQVALPSADFNALFLLKHCASHFSSVKMTLRQLLDWLLFVENHQEEIDWVRVHEVYREYHLDEFAAVLNAIGVRWLGFDAKLFPEISTDEELIGRVVDDILSPEFKESENGTLCSALWVKPRRWWHNRWKHKLCYSDGLLSSFLYGLWAKIIKPKHFIK